MLKAALAGLFACAAIIAVNSSTASAQALDLLQTETENQSAAAVLVASLEAKNEPVRPNNKSPESVTHRVQPHQTLIDIAEKYHTTWQRLFDKNPKIADPDALSVGEKVVIPSPDEKLKRRPLPATTMKPKRTVVQRPVKSVRSRPASRSAATAGNTYTPGYCTWYVKNRRPDLPNGLGNANTWVTRARSFGLATGAKPRAGAVGQRGMHVVYVERVNSNGTVLVSEMNYRGLYITSQRTVPASSFYYIY